MTHLLAVILTFMSMSWLAGLSGADLHINQPIVRYFAATKAADMSVKDYWQYTYQHKIQGKFMDIEANHRVCKKLFQEYNEMNDKLRLSMKGLIGNKQQMTMDQIRSFQSLHAIYQEEREGLIALLSEVDRIMDYGNLWGEIAPAETECDYESIYNELDEITDNQSSAIERLKLAIKNGHALSDIIQGES